jgi:hypothetical protein
LPQTGREGFRQQRQAFQAKCRDSRKRIEQCVSFSQAEATGAVPAWDEAAELDSTSESLWPLALLLAWVMDASAVSNLKKGRKEMSRHFPFSI